VTEPSPRWQERAVERSLRTARAKAVSRSERFIGTATQLLGETGATDFTIQDLVERSGLSLRAFYQHFATKDDLLLAVFEEAIRTFVAQLRADLAGIDDPIERLHTYVASFYSAAETSQPISRALSRYLMLLTASEPGELARVLEPQTSLLLEIIEAGIGTQQVRRDVSPQHLTLLVTQTLMAAVEMNVLGAHLGDQPLGAESLWRYCHGAVAAPARGPDSALKRRR
jgi:AcrR family transcriptional regulator